MKVQSTGLGKTVMLAHFQDLFNTRFEDQHVLQMNMESTEPLHWTIKVYMEPSDIRRAVLMGLKPSILWKALLALVFGTIFTFRKGRTPGGTSAGETPARAEPTKTVPAPGTGAKAGPLAGLKQGGGSGRTDAPNPLASLKG